MNAMEKQHQAQEGRMDEEGEEREERNKRELMRKGTRKLRVSSRAWVLHIVVAYIGVGGAERREERYERTRKEEERRKQREGGEMGEGMTERERERGVASAPRDAAAGKSEMTAVERR